MRKVVWAVLLLLAAAGGVRYWLADNQAQSRAKDAKARPPAPVALAGAITEDMPLLLEAVGRAEAFETVALKSRLDGQVLAVEYREGEHVREGQVLVRLDPGDLEARLRQVAANLARDQALLDKARIDLKRYVSLRERHLVSEEKAGEVRTALAAAEATVKADRAAVDLAKLQLGYATIRAPFAGVVGARLVSPGAAVKVNETELAVVNRVQPLYVSFAVPEKYSARLRAALRASPLRVTARLPGDAERQFEGEARFLDNAVDVATSTIQLKAVLPNADELLTPGQFLNVSVPLDTLRNAVTVPAEAVQEGPDGSFVYVVTPEQLAELRPVEVAAAQRGRIAVGSGLRAGELVITEGHLRVSPGAKVQPKAPSIQAGSGN
jgi:multidrug efflux system membrane fusion protein